MRIGYLHGLDSSGATGGDAVHARALTQALTRPGVEVMTLAAAPDAGAGRLPNTRWGRLRMALAADLYYIRVHGSPRQERYGERRIARWLPKPIVWEVNAPLDEMAVQAGLARAGVATLEAERRLAARRVAAATCMSPELEKYAASLGIARTLYVPNGSDPELFAPERRAPGPYPGPPGRFTVLWAGSMKYRWQGWDLVVELARAAAPTHPDILFVIVGAAGGGGDRPELPNLLWMPPQPYARMPTLIASADACLCLYHRCDWSSIGFYFSPLKLFDYMASGRAIIGTNLGEIGRVIQDGRNGLLTTNDIPELVRHVSRLRGDPELRRRLGAAAREDVVRRYNWRRAADQTLGLFESVLEARG